MELVSKPDPEDWSRSVHCKSCDSHFILGVGDIEFDRFKKPNTYWFDGTADEAGLLEHWFWTCSECNDLHFIDNAPKLVRKQVKDQWIIDGNS